MKVDSWAVMVPWLLSLLTVAVGIYQFRTQQAQANRRPFLEQQLATVTEATDVAARLASETDPEEWDKARAAFWRLYWGRLAIVEDAQVEDRMVKFGRLVPKGPAAEVKLPVQALKDPSLSLSHAARDLILQSWDVHLAPLEGRPE